jgi:hypothetical protein
MRSSSSRSRVALVTQGSASKDVPIADDIGAPIDQDRQATKPRLLIESWNPNLTVAALRDILAKETDRLFDRGVPVRVAFNNMLRGSVAHPLTHRMVVLMAHEVCRPYRVQKGEEVDTQLPSNVAAMYLDWVGQWKLEPLNGIASTPMLREDGSIYSAEGYDSESGMWLENVPDITSLVSEKPTFVDAKSALQYLRETFRTFCFADAETVPGEIAVVDVTKPPGKDESAFLTALLTAVCRPSLHLAPGLLLRAALLSGAGTGKGLLARCICIIAFGRDPQAFTGGGTSEELEKRIASELIEGNSVLFLDNLNDIQLKSDILASALTERPARVRLLGKSQMLPLNASAFVVLTGNGLSVSEDLARRFLTVELDPRTEDPEARPFRTDIRAEVTRNRNKLLAALLTIWRWGRLHADLPAGRPLGSFEQWGRWVRDALVALGCRDAAERVAEAKEQDGQRQSIAELFGIWWEKHRDRPIVASKLHEDIKNTLDPQGRSRQFLASKLAKLAGTRMAGFVLTRQQASGNWSASTYALKWAGGEDHRTYRDHREHRALEILPEIDDPYADAESQRMEQAGVTSNVPIPPMAPMASRGATDTSSNQDGSLGLAGAHSTFEPPPDTDVVYGGNRQLVAPTPDGLMVPVSPVNGGDESSTQDRSSSSASGRPDHSNGTCIQELARPGETSSKTTPGASAAKRPNNVRPPMSPMSPMPSTGEAEEASGQEQNVPSPWSLEL